MDKLLTQAMHFLSELQGVVDQITKAVQAADSYHATLQPKLEHVAQVEARLAEKSVLLSEVENKLATASAQYEALRQKIL